MTKAFSNFIYLLFLLPIVISSCSKDEINAPDFDVQATTATVKAGEPITFSFSGNPDYLTFYSGETGHVYANRSRTAELGTTQTLKFSTAVASGSQTNNLKVMVSTDFNGNYTAADVAKATWTDITSRAKLATGATLASGSISINDFAAAAKPFYIGFYYYAPLNALKPRNWTVSLPSITNTLADGTVSTVLADFPSAGFKNVNVQNANANWNISASSMVMTGGSIGDPIAEAWAISTAINLDKVAAPDLGVGIKSIDVLLPSYTYTYTTAGTYKVTFLAANTDLKDSKSSVKEMTINVVN